MKWTIPNYITIARIGISAVFFAIIGFYTPAIAHRGWLMGTAFVVYVLAGLSDILDGYLARRLNQVSDFGRIADPIVDKVLIVGAFAMLAGPDFAMGQTPYVGEYEKALPAWLTGKMISSIQPWMVVLIIAREFVISGIRGYCESQGKKFPAIPIGKLKMFLQTFAIGTVLFCMAWAPTVVWMIWTKIIVVWLSVFITIGSGLIYVRKAANMLKESPTHVA